MVSDHNNIEALMGISNFVRVSKLILIILNISYFFGIIFYIVADFSIQMYHPDETTQDYFIDYYGLNLFTDSHKTITMIYYAFTSLSTVGLGDLVPRSNIERLFVSFSLLIGVAIFSYTLEEFIQILV